MSGNNSEIILAGRLYISAKLAGELTGYTSDYIGQLSRAGKIQGKILGRTRFVDKESLLSYLRETDELSSAEKEKKLSKITSGTASYDITDTVSDTQLPPLSKEKYREPSPELSSAWGEVSYSVEADTRRGIGEDASPASKTASSAGNHNAHNAHGVHISPKEILTTMRAESAEPAARAVQLAPSRLLPSGMGHALLAQIASLVTGITLITAGSALFAVSIENTPIAGMLAGTEKRMFYAVESDTNDSARFANVLARAVMNTAMFGDTMHYSATAFRVSAATVAAVHELSAEESPKASRIAVESVFLGDYTIRDKLGSFGRAVRSLFNKSALTVYRTLASLFNTSAPAADTSGLAQYDGIESSSISDTDGDTESALAELSYDDEKISLAEPVDDKLPAERSRASDASASVYASAEPVVIEKRIFEQPIFNISGVSEELLTERLQVLDNKLTSKLNELSAREAGNTTVIHQNIAQSQRIDTLKNVTITNLTVSSVSGLTDSDIPNAITVSGYLPTSGGTVDTLAVTASTTFNGVEYLFPSADGTANQVLSTNGAGGLSWTTSSGGAGVPDWQKETNFNTLTLTPTTTIPIWLKDAIYASSTLIVQGDTTLANVTAANATTTNATTTHIAITGTAQLGTVTSGTWQGTVIDEAYGGLGGNFGDLSGVLYMLTGSTTASTTLTSFVGGTGFSSYSTGDLLYGNSAGVLTKLTAGTDGKVLKLAGGVPTWDTDNTGSGGSGFWATTTNDQIVYPTDTNDIVVIGGNATTTIDSIKLQVIGGAFFDRSTTTAATTTALSVSGTIDTPLTQNSIFFAGAGGLLSEDNSAFSYNATGNRLTVTYASSTALTVSGTASTSNLIASNNFTFKTVTGFLKATAGAVATSLIDLTADITGTLGVSNGGTGWGNIQSNTLVLGNGTSAISTTTAGTNGQVLSLVSGTPSWTATTTFSSGLTYSNGNVTADLGTDIDLKSAEVNDNFTDGSVLFWGTTAVSEDNSAFSYNSTGNRLTVTYASSTALTVSGSADIGTLILAGGSITDTSGAISFGNENLTTTGTLSSGNTTVTGTLSASSLSAFSGGASTTLASVTGILYVGGTATTTITGDTSTSTFKGGVSTNGAIDVQSTTATSTFGNGIEIANGGIRLRSDICAGLGNGGALVTDANGFIVCEADDGGSSVFSWTPDTTYGENANSTTTPIWLKDTLYASSTSFFTGLASFTNATATQVTVSGQAYFNSSTTFNGVEYLFPSSDGSANQILSTNGAGGLSWTTSSGGAFSWTPTTTYGENTNATSTPIFFRNSIYASSTRIAFDTTSIIFASSSASTLTVSYASAATSTIPNAKNYAWTIATSTTGLPFFSINTNGGIATTTIRGGLVIDGGRFTHDYGAGVTSIENLELGPISFDTDAGAVSWVNLPFSSTTPAGTAESFTAQINDTSILTIYAQTDGSTAAPKNVRVVIGTSTDAILGSSNIPYGSLIIADGALCVDDGSGANCDDAAISRGEIAAETTTIQNIDLAENYPTKDASLEAGDIVMFDTDNEVFVKKFDIASTSEISRLEFLGVISTAPGVLLGGFGDKIFTNEIKVPVTLSGRVPVKVNLEGGDIAVGDRITYSSVAGVGTKATTSAITIGIALESFTASSTKDTVIAFIDSDYTLARSEFFIGSNGNIGIGTTTPGYKLHVAGDIAANSFINVSTKDAKTDIAYLTGADTDAILEKIKRTNIATYIYTGEAVSGTDERGSITDGKRLGLIAEEAPHEVLSVDGKGVDIYKLTTFIFAGIQAQEKLIEDIQIKISDIESALAMTGSSTPDTAGEALYTGDGFMDTIFAFVLDKLRAFGIRIETNIIRVANFVTDTITTKDLVTDGIEVGSPENRSGVTLYDMEDGTPYCLQIAGGAISSTQGVCGEVGGTDGGGMVDDTALSTGGGDITADNEPPTLALVGNNPARVPLGASYSDMGVTVTDNVDENLGYKIYLDGSLVTFVSLDTATTTTYEIIYTASDNAGNTATSTRTVIIEAPEPAFVEVPVDNGNASTTPDNTASGIATTTESTVTE